VKKILCSLTLVAALVPFVSRSAAAQEVKAMPVPSLDWIIATRPVPGTLTIKPIEHSPTPPRYCTPCLFYGGDTSPNSPNANGIANENTLFVPEATMYIPFIVPTGQKWLVSGLFTNNLADGYDGIDPMQATWSVSRGMSNGNGGTVIASGTATATFAPTGRMSFGFTEYTVLVDLTVATAVHLGGGVTYWLTVVPQCTDSGNSNCSIAQYYLTNTEGLNAYGPPEPRSDSFYNAAFFGYSYEPACDVSSTGCQLFSAGVLGKVF
jgi:hypothetical protein